MALPGSNIIIEVRDTAGAGSFVEVGGINNFTISDGSEVLDSSQFGGASGSPLRYAREKFKGIEHFTLELSGDLLPSDAGQIIMTTGRTGGLEVQVQILYDGVDGDRLPCKVFGKDRSGSVDGKAEVSFSCEGNGLIVAAS